MQIYQLWLCKDFYLFEKFQGQEINSNYLKQKILLMNLIHFQYQSVYIYLFNNLEIHRHTKCDPNQLNHAQMQDPVSADD